MLPLINLANLVIPINTKPSNSVEVGTANDICIFSPSSLTGTITVQVSQDNTTWVDLKSGGSSVTVGASAGVVITNCAFKWLRVNSGSDEGTARTFGASMQERAP